MQTLLELAFDGFDYRGWQMQANAISVQGELVRVLRKTFQTKISVHGATRTDAGVHANHFLAVAALPDHPYVKGDQLLTLLNRNLPPAIQIKAMTRQAPGFSLNQSITAKNYSYLLSNGPILPHLGRFCQFPGENFDWATIQSVLPIFVGKHDFANFTVRSHEHENTECELWRVELFRTENFTTIHLIGDRFLYKMARMIIGALTAVGQGKLSKDELEGLLENTQLRDDRLQTASPNGLFLNRTYQDDSWQGADLNHHPLPIF